MSLLTVNHIAVVCRTMNIIALQLQAQVQQLFSVPVAPDLFWAQLVAIGTLLYACHHLEGRGA